MQEEVKNKVYELLKKDDSGHGIDHIDRVLKLTLKFAKEEGANLEIASLIALLHDVDDYKLFGKENAKNLTNARRILMESSIDSNTQKLVLTEINNIGYSKYLAGHRPKTLEGKIVSDADMCDALGATGIIRVYTYSLKHQKPFFDKNIFPNLDMNAKEYTNRCADTSVCHLFEKILKLHNLMLTNSGKIEAKARHQIIVDFLYQFFKEEDATEWQEYLTKYLKKTTF